MAKGLQVGDIVKANRMIKDEATGKPAIEPGRSGQVVKAGAGHSMIVDFDGLQLRVSTQRLDLVEKPKGKRGRPKGSPKQPAAPTKQNAPSNPATDLLNLSNPQIMAQIANKLLMSGGVDAAPDTVVIEMRLADLPDNIQRDIKQLIERKLSLSLEDVQPRKAGRPKKNNS